MRRYDEPSAPIMPAEPPSVGADVQYGDLYVCHPSLLELQAVLQKNIVVMCWFVGLRLSLYGD